MSTSRVAAVVLAVVLGAACGDEDELCDPVEQTGCDDGLVCEEVQGGDPACFAPVVVRGQVFDLADGAGIGGARVVALDVNRAPVSTVAVSDDDGNYELPVPSVRLEDGTPVGLDVTLRADASGYQTFPGGLRQALPIDTATATVAEDGFHVVMSALTAIGLIALPGGGGTGALHGTVEPPPSGAGVLVVAETGGAGFTAIADRDGDYTIFNLAEGTYDVAGYARGVNYVGAQAEIVADSTTDLDLALSEEATATLTGSVNIVNPGEGNGTSVILVVESTFNEALVRGESPPGMRAPDPGMAPTLNGAFTIEGVPAGGYVVLAAFENDFLVRDPDSCIAGTDILHQQIGVGEQVNLEESFKITGSLDVIGPGAEGAEAVDGAPTLEWVDDSSEDEYRLIVLDSFGETVWDTIEDRHTGDDPAVPYGGPALEAGMYYQFRVTSVRKPAGEDACEISQTEDLKGVFFVSAP